MAKATAAYFAVKALENLPVSHTFGIPGVHTTELYDELDRSATITPHLVSSEFSGSFMAEALSRTTDTIGTLVIVPGAGFTHAASGIGEAYLDGIPLLVISGGVNYGPDFPGYQLHDVDQLELAKGITKAAFRVTSHKEVVETIYRAYDIATTGVPGPVFVELPMNLLLTVSSEDIDIPSYQPPSPPVVNSDEIATAVRMLTAATKPVLYLGWGARGAGQEKLVELAERLEAPVTTTLQGLGVFPHDHPLHAGFGFGPAATPAGRNAFADHDCMLAIGCRFAEIPTGSYGIKPPTGLIHADIDPKVFNRNYPAAATITGDATAIIDALLDQLPPAAQTASELRSQIAEDKRRYRTAFARSGKKDLVNPARFFTALENQTEPNAITVLDDGHHTFLAAELWPVKAGSDLISPTDFNAMGYAVPAAIGSKLGNPNRFVQAIVGDGCFRMSCMELITAASNKLGIVIYVFTDGELRQISVAQSVPYNKKVCTVLPSVNLAGVAAATGCEYLKIDPTQKARHMEQVMEQAAEYARHGRPVIVEVPTDSSRKTSFTKSILATNFFRFSSSEKVRFARRFLRRHLLP